MYKELHGYYIKGLYNGLNIGPNPRLGIVYHKVGYADLIYDP